MRRVHVAGAPVREAGHLALHVADLLALDGVVEGGTLGVVVADNGVTRAVDFDILPHLVGGPLGEGDAGVAFRVVAGDVGGEGWGRGTPGAGGSVGGGWEAGGEGAVEGEGWL